MNSSNSLSFLLCDILTILERGNISEQLTFEQVHFIPWPSHAGMRASVQSCRHVRMPKLSQCRISTQANGDDDSDWIFGQSTADAPEQGSQPQTLLVFGIVFGIVAESKKQQENDRQHGTGKLS